MLSIIFHLLIKHEGSAKKCCLLTGEVNLPVAARLKKLGSWGGAIGVANLRQQRAIPGAWRVLGTRPWAVSCAAAGQEGRESWWRTW